MNTFTVIDYMDPVKIVEGALDLGFSLPEAIGRAAGCSLTELAASHGFTRSVATMCLHGYPNRTFPAFRDALAQQFGVGREVVDHWIERWAATRAKSSDGRTS